MPHDGLNLSDVDVVLRMCDMNSFHLTIYARNAQGVLVEPPLG